MLSTNSKFITENNNILGFANIDDTGYIDMFYIHADYQGAGLGSLLLNSLENDVDVKLFSVHASITALLFLNWEDTKLNIKIVFTYEGKTLLTILWRN